MKKKFKITGRIEVFIEIEVTSECKQSAIRLFKENTEIKTDLVEVDIPIEVLSALNVSKYSNKIVTKTIIVP